MKRPFSACLALSFVAGFYGLTDARDGQSLVLQSAPADTPRKVFTLSERNGRACLLTPEGKPFMILGLSHVGGAFQGAAFQNLTDSERDTRLPEETKPSTTMNGQERDEQRKREKPNDGQVRDALKEVFAAGATAWSAKNFAAVRAEYRKTLAMDNAPSPCRSYARLRIAQSYAAEKNTAGAKAEYEKIKANAAYPEAHRYVAE
ncbi:MAG: hypothetical protein NTW86_09605 [Candidatus Sumerlaeota bacterium]|nr:hypothetical protein [Candidatus Sumerlaeota bacterium]